MSDELIIEIELPDTRNRSLGRYKPKGTLILKQGSSKEFIKVPFAVGRAIKKLQAKDELRASTAAAFKEELSRITEDCAWKRILSLIDKRDYSSLETDEKLKLDGYDESVRKAAVSRATSCYLINDERYGEFYVRSKVDAGWGRERIARELERKGISIDSIPGWPDEYFSDESDYDRALAIASRKHLTGKNDFAKIMRLLASKGYSPQVAYRVAYDVLGEE